jgi:hypothetical protein
MQNPYPPCTPESIQQILSFLPAFERGDFRDAHDFYMQSGQNPPRVDELISAVYRSGFVFPFDWIAWDKRGALRAIDTADVLTLRKLMTAFVRGDRFHGGAMPRLCADGTVQKVLHRLSVIAAHGGESAGTA